MEDPMKMSSGDKSNRTGMSSSAFADQMRQVTGMTHPTKADGALNQAHAFYFRETSALGSVPPPASTKGVAKAALQALKGKKAIALADKIAERLAFERTGVRLYDALIDKFDNATAFSGGPSREELEHFRNEEHQHALMLAEALEQLGADPTAVTPSADLVSMEGAGLGSVLSDARTTLGQCLHAMIVAELADGEGWTLLGNLADEMGQKELVARFDAAEEEEAHHLTSVRNWLTAYVRAEAELI